jgi:hypothetical protein
MKAYGRVETKRHAFLTLAIYDGKWLASRSGHFAAGEMAFSTHWLGALVSNCTYLSIFAGLFYRI